MNKIVKIFLTIIILLFSIWNVFAWDENTSSWVTINEIKIKVPEKIPWANCNLDKENKYNSWLYICTISPWMSAVNSIIQNLIKWFMAITAISWVLFIVVNWILLSMHWWEKEKIKTRITATITWIVLLLLSWVILSIIAPWVYK